MSEEISSQWVNATVDREDLGEFCDEFIVDGKCTKCERSAQLDLGMTPAELLRNISKN
jgi:hypothetical protein